jgi:hypothetical protein
MFTLTISLDYLAVSIIVAGVVILLTHNLYIFNRKRLIDKSIKNITEFIEEYFMNTGAEVQVTCFKLEGNKRFVALIQSEPLKQFRCSYVLESNLITHISEVTGNTVEKIYWRFPIKLNKDLMTATEKNSLESDDLYFSDGYAIAEAAREYKVSEVSWDQYESPKEEK